MQNSTVDPAIASQSPPAQLSNNSEPVGFWWAHFLRELLLHFLILGALLFGLYQTVKGSTITPSSPYQTEISASTIAQLKPGWHSQWRRESSPQELRTQIDPYIHDDVFYQEARALGLEQDDTIVRQHSIPGQISFLQVYVSRELQGDRADANAQTVLKPLQANRRLAKSNTVLGDRAMLPSAYTPTSTQQPTNAPITTFAQELATVIESGWQGPFHSVYGTDVSTGTALELGRAGTLAEVGGVVRLDWLNEQRHQDAAYQPWRDRTLVAIAPNTMAQPTVQPVVDGEAI